MADGRNLGSETHIITHANTRTDANNYCGSHAYDVAAFDPGPHDDPNSITDPNVFGDTDVSVKRCMGT